MCLYLYLIMVNIARAIKNFYNGVKIKNKLKLKYKQLQSNLKSINILERSV